MSFTVEEARKTGETLQKAASVIPVRSTRYELHERGREWLAAANELDGVDEGEAVIELVGQIGVAMRVIGDDEAPWWPVRRVLGSRDGQFSIQVENPNRPQPVYRNFAGSSSPVVVKS